MELMLWGIAALFVGAICGVICISIAEPRGGNLAAAFWIGFLLGPLGLLVVLLLRNDEVRTERQLHMGHMKQCPLCAEAVLPAARVCRYCGHEFAPPEQG